VTSLLAMLLIPACFLGASLLLDAHGVVVPAKVAAKREQIHFGHEGFWSRTLGVSVELPRSIVSPTGSPLGVGGAPAQYDQIQVGDRLDVRVLRVGRYCRLGRGAGRSTRTAFPWSGLRIFGLIWGAALLICVGWQGRRRKSGPLSIAGRLFVG